MPWQRPAPHGARALTALPKMPEFRNSPHPPRPPMRTGPCTLLHSTPARRAPGTRPHGAMHTVACGLDTLIFALHGDAKWSLLLH